MAERRESRRVQMTKRLMKEALLELLEESELVSITVTSICETADVHRSTFYKYYSDPADLMRDLERDYLDQIPMPSTPPDQQQKELLLEETTTFFDYVKENERAFRIFFADETSSSFSARIIDRLSEQYDAGEKDGDIHSHYASLYVAYGTVGLLREWVNTGFPVDSRSIADMMYEFSSRVN